MAGFLGRFFASLVIKRKEKERGEDGAYERKSMERFRGGQMGY